MRTRPRLFVLVSALLIVGVLVMSVPASSLHAQATSAITRSAFFNGTDGYFRVAHDPALNPTGAITIEAWVKRSNAGNCETVVGKDFSKAYWLGFCTNTIRFYTGGGSRVDGNTSIPAGTWTHIAVTFDGTTRKFYVNGTLDKTDTSPGSLGTSTADLGIGANIAEDGTVNFPFEGDIDEVRLWEVARTQDEIQGGMYRQINSEPGLVAEWRLSNDGRNYTSSAYAGTGNNVFHTFRGVLPKIVNVYQYSASISVDGQCSTGSEYASAERVQAGFATVYLLHTADDLYVCFSGLEQGTNRRALVAFDRDKSGTDPAGSDDYRFAIDINGNPLAEQGDGAGGFTTLSSPGDWEAAHYVSGDFVWSAEFRFARDITGAATGWRDRIGLALTEDRDGDMRPWPVGAEAANPSTWGEAYLPDYGAYSVETFSLDGYVRDGADDAGIANATVQLLTANAGFTELVDTTETDSSGYYSFDYEGYAPDQFVVQERDNRGYRSQTASAGADGAVVTPNMLRYPGAGAGDTTYSSGLFYDTNRPHFATFDTHYLIVYGDPVEEADLWPLIRLKRMQGFQVRTRTVEDIDASGVGRDRAEKIRNWLKANWSSHPDEPTYALLVGTTDVLPARQMAWEGDNAHRPAETDGSWKSPAIPMDWYYADLNTNWDRDGDGWYGEYISCAPGEEEVPVVAWPAHSSERAPCPPAGSALRESAFGSAPGSADDWVAEISVGRVMVSEAEQVRTAIRTMVAAETSGSPDKREAMLAGSFWGMEGRTWKDGSYVEGGTDGSDWWMKSPWDGSRPYGDDTAVYLDEHLKPSITPYLDTITKLYETTHPAGGASPTAKTADLPVSQTNVEDQWGRQGLVNIVGHGDENGISSVHWLHEYDQSGIINQPADPASCSGDGCWEMQGYRLIDKNTPAPDSIAPVVFANACSTGAPWIVERRGTGDAAYNVSIAGSVPIASHSLGQGWASAWIGGLSVVPVHGLDQYETDLNHEFLATPLRLGDALWKYNRPLADADGDGYAHDWRRLDMTLFGDPARTYWGNTADTVAAWPQYGQNWFSTHSTPYNGPDAGSVRWSQPASSPPVVDRDGNVIVGGVGQAIAYRPNGSVDDSGSVGSGAQQFSPALATDGIYVASGSRLYIRDLDFQNRGSIYLGSPVTGAPKVGPDGVVWVPTQNGVKRVTGSGHVETFGAGHEVSGPVAFSHASGVVNWTTTDGYLHSYRLTRTGEQFTGASRITTESLNPPAVGSDGTVYMTAADGHVYAVGPSPWTADLSDPISAPASVGPDGKIYIVTEDGFVDARNPDGTREWAYWLREPIQAPAVADNSRVFFTVDGELYVVNAESGDLIQRLDLGGAVDERSTPVIGADRTLYVTRADDQVVAVSEYGLLMAPSDVRAVVDGPKILPGQAQVSWEDNSSGEGGFNIEVCDLTGACNSWLTVGANTTGTTVQQLMTNESMFFRVQAIGGQQTLAAGDSPNSEYASSNIVTPKPAAPATPTGLAVAPQSAEELALSWTYDSQAAEQLAGFDIYRRKGTNGTFDLLTTVAPDRRNFVDTGLLPDTTYSYQLTARNAGGASGKTSTKSARTLPDTLPAPTQLDVTQNGCLMTLNWQDNADSENMYYVERRLPGTGTYELAGTVGAGEETFVDGEPLVYEGTLGYRVKAANASAESPYAYTSVTWTAACAASPKVRTFLPVILQP